QLPLEPIDPRRQLPDLAIHPQKHLDHDLPASVVDRLRLAPLHATRFDNAKLCPPTQLNAYAATAFYRPFVSFRYQTCPLVPPLTFSRNEGVPGSSPGVSLKAACYRAVFVGPGVGHRGGVGAK